MRIPLFKPYIFDNVVDDLREIFKSGWIGLGPKVEEFEQAFCDYTGSKYAVATNSCTAALHLALICAGIKKDTTVCSTPMTFVSTNQAIKYCGAYTDFVDIDPNTLCMDPAKLLESIEEYGPPEAVVVVHYGGQPADIEMIEQISEYYSFPFIYDCAHAMGASYCGKKIGSFEKFACFSFHAVKNLGIGDGGMLATNDKEIYERARRLRWMGIDSSTYERNAGGSYKWNYSVTEVGYKYHMNDISAVIGLSQIKCLESQNELRRLVGLSYQHLLRSLWDTGKIDIVNPDNQHCVSAQHLFVIKLLSGSRNDLHDYLADRGITTGVHYYPNDLYEFLANNKMACPESEKASKQILSLPMYWQMTQEEQEYVCEAITSYFDSI